MKYLLLISLFFLNCNLHSCYKNTVKDSRGRNILKICIEGHIYYYNSGSGLAPKLTDDGKPCPCQGELQQ